MTQAAYGPHSVNRGRSAGCETKAISTPTGNRIDVYFELNARPSATPAPIHARSDSGPRGADWMATVMKYMATATAASRDASGVARTRPAAANGMTLMM